MTDTLINKYRPSTFDEVIGHEVQVRALESALKKGTARTFLFTGPPGTGKTTLARIAAQQAGCQPANLVEIDAATNTGIDAMREVTANLMYKALGDGGVKAIIVDEVHALSKQAFQSLLKVLEEPPEWVYWFLCTTEPTKVPVAVRTRCLVSELKPVPTKVLGEWLSGIAEEEKLDKDIGKAWGGVIDLCVKEAQGSPRQALSNLAACSACTSLEEARDLLRSAEGSSEAIDLARALIQRARWSEVQGLLRVLKETSPESVRHVIRAYVTTVIINAKSEKDAGLALEILDAFSQPFNSHDGASPLVLACGKVLLS